MKTGFEDRFIKKLLKSTGFEPATLMAMKLLQRYAKLFQSEVPFHWKIKEQTIPE